MVKTNKHAALLLATFCLFQLSSAKIYDYSSPAKSTLNELREAPIINGMGDLLEGSQIVNPQILACNYTILWETLIPEDRFDVFSCSSRGITEIHVDALTVANQLVAYRMREVHLANNYLTIITPGTFDFLPTLRRLDLSNNRLRVLPAGMFNLNQHLQRLDLSNNELEKIEEDFSPVSLLQDVDLSSNNLVDFGRVPFASILASDNMMRTLNVADNHFECMCDLQWLMDADVNPSVTIVERSRKTGAPPTPKCPQQQGESTSPVTLVNLIKNKADVMNKIKTNKCNTRAKLVWPKVKNQDAISNKLHNERSVKYQFGGLFIIGLAGVVALGFAGSSRI